jgi:hypothetical protein
MSWVFPLESGDNLKVTLLDFDLSEVPIVSLALLLSYSRSSFFSSGSSLSYKGSSYMPSKSTSIFCFERLFWLLRDYSIERCSSTAGY